MTEPATPRAVPDRLARWLATGFGAGYAPIAPGTVGTLLAVPLYLAAAQLPLPAYVVVTGIMGWIGVLACERVVRLDGVRDPQYIVWDEITGFFVTMTAAPGGWEWVAAGFCVFRVLDIAKPWPVGWLDRHVGGGRGVMADDVAAGAYGLVALQCAAWWFA